MKCMVKVDNINAVKEFVNITFMAEHDVDLICGRYHIDAKSIMGIFSLPLDKPLELEMDDRDAEMLKEKLAKFIVG